VIKDDAEFNYSALNNRAVSQARGDVLCFLNNDTVVLSSEWLDEMVSHAVRAEIGVVGAKLLFPDGRIQHAGVVLGIGGFAGHVFSGCPGDTHGYMGRAQLIQNYTALTGACMVVRRSVFVEVGGFNETELKISFNDIDFCLRVHAAGYRNLWTPYALLYHHQGATRGEDITVAQKERAAAEAIYFRNQWRELIYDDPAYNPSLSIAGADYEMAFPPRIRGRGCRRCGASGSIKVR
jgi:GT2 family glycosyltransferase